MFYEMQPPTSCSFVHKRIIGGIKGALTGGVTGALGGFLGPTDQGGGGARRPSKAERAILLTQRRFATAPANAQINQVSGLPFTNLAGQILCNPGFELRGGQCVPIVQIGGGGSNVPMLPPTTNITTPAEGAFQAVSGAFGMPAIAPRHEFVGRFNCPKGMVLGEDELCYPKQVLRRDSRFRKWKPGVRPLLTGGQRNNLRKARVSLMKVKEAGSSLGLTVKKKC